MTQLRSQLAKLKEDNDAEETSLKRRKQGSEQSLADYINLYDQMMDEKNKEL